MPIRRWLLVLFCVGSLLAVTALYYDQSGSYWLRVSNNSDDVVDQVAIFGRGVKEGAVISMLQPGGEGELYVDLNKVGDVRVGVAQGLNRIDTLIARDVSKLQQRKQQLSIRQSGQFIISDLP